MTDERRFDDLLREDAARPAAARRRRDQSLEHGP